MRKQECMQTYLLLLAAFGRLDGQIDSIATSVAGDDLRIELELQPLLLKNLLSRLRDLHVHAWTTNLAEEFDNGNFGAQPRPHGSL